MDDKPVFNQEGSLCHAGSSSLAYTQRSDRLTWVISPARTVTRVPPWSRADPTGPARDRSPCGNVHTGGRVKPKKSKTLGLLPIRLIVKPSNGRIQENRRPMNIAARLVPIALFLTGSALLDGSEEQPQDATRAILAAFDRYQLVGMGA